MINILTLSRECSYIISVSWEMLLKYITIFLCYQTCARRDHFAHQRMNANGLLPYDLFSWNKAKQDGEVLNIVSWKIITVCIQNSNYSQRLHTLCTMGPPCHVGLFFQSSWLLHKSVAPSSAADQLLILLPAISPSQVDPISLRVQAPSLFFDDYKTILVNLQ